MLLRRRSPGGIRCSVLLAVTPTQSRGTVVVAQLLQGAPLWALRVLPVLQCMQLGKHSRRVSC